jgi:predicted nucleic acid-binding protein
LNYALDTNVFRETWHPRGNATVKAVIASIDEGKLYMSVIVLGELCKGIAKLPPGEKQTKLIEWVDHVEAQFAGRVVPIDAAISKRWGEMTGRLAARGRVLPTPDSLIAATALHHDLTLLTRNVADFADTDVRVLDPWTTPIP